MAMRWMDGRDMSSPVVGASSILDAVAGLEDLAFAASRTLPGIDPAETSHWATLGEQSAALDWQRAARGVTSDTESDDDDGGGYDDDRTLTAIPLPSTQRQPWRSFNEPLRPSTASRLPRRQRAVEPVLPSRRSTPARGAATSRTPRSSAVSSTPLGSARDDTTRAQPRRPGSARLTEPETSIFIMTTQPQDNHAHRALDMGDSSFIGMRERGRAASPRGRSVHFEDDDTTPALEHGLDESAAYEYGLNSSLYATVDRRAVTVGGSSWDSWTEPEPPTAAPAAPAPAWSSSSSSTAAQHRWPKPRWQLLPWQTIPLSAAAAAAADPTAPLPQPELPTAWEERTSRSTGDLYWYNPITDQSTYERPEPLPDGWEMKISTSSGEPYYFNEKTGESTYEKPGEGEGSGPKSETAARLSSMAAPNDKKHKAEAEEDEEEEELAIMIAQAGTLGVIVAQGGKVDQVVVGGVGEWHGITTNHWIKYAATQPIKSNQIPTAS